MTRRTDRFYKLFKHGNKHLMLNIRFIKFWLIIGTCFYLQKSGIYWARLDSFNGQFDPNFIVMYLIN